MGVAVVPAGGRREVPDGETESPGETWDDGRREEDLITRAQTPRSEAARQVDPVAEGATPPVGRRQRVQELKQHLFVYALVNGALWIAWIAVGLVDGFGFIFPIFPTVLWGLALIVHAVTVYRAPDDTPRRGPQ